jgi:chromosome segregation ATPase
MTENVTEEVKIEGDNTEPEIKIEAADAKGGSQQEDQEVSLEEGIQELKKKLEAEQNARAEAEKRAQEMQQQAHRAQTEVQDSNLQLIHSAMEAVKRNADALKQHYAAALQAGAFDKAAEIQEQMGINSAKLLQLENGRAALEDKLKNAPQTLDPVEQVASQLSPRSAQWVRNHPQCITDKRLYQKMVGAHNIAVADGFIPDTDDYFEFIEQQIGFKKPPARETEVQVDEPMSAASAPAQRRNAPPAAPSSRAASGTSGSKNVVRLSADEREVAQIMGMTPEEYAKNKLALKREGKLN